VMEPRSKFDRLVLTGRLVEAGLTLVAEAEGFAKHDLVRARGIRNGIMIALLALCPIRLKNFATVEIGQTFKNVQGRWWITLPGNMTKTGRPARRASCPSMVEPLHGRVSEPIATRPASVQAAHERSLDLLHDRPADDHKEPRDADLQNHS
jgi:hypothetical protein